MLQSSGNAAHQKRGKKDRPACELLPYLRFTGAKGIGVLTAGCAVTAASAEPRVPGKGGAASWTACAL